MKNALFAFLLVAPLIGAQNNACAPIPPAPCNEDACCRTYCLGPTNTGINAPVYPLTCNGDWVVSFAGFYWNAHQDAMEFAINNEVTEADWESNERFIASKYVYPDSSWDFGFKLGIGYNTTCDGWDFGAEWTRFVGHARKRAKAQLEENRILLALWPYVDSTGGTDTFANVTEILAKWKVEINLVDLSVGRTFWNSKYLSLRPFIGLRYAKIQQDYRLVHEGGEFADTTAEFRNEVDLRNDFHGFGFRGGICSVWNFGCGWGLYGDLALSGVYGRFDVEHDEKNIRLDEPPFPKTKILDMERSFRVMRYIVDAGIGVRWAGPVCDCSYYAIISLGWEAHLFEGQNQMNRVVHDGQDIAISPTQGNLDTQGWTLKVTVQF